MQKLRLALGWVACVAMSLIMVARVRGGDPTQFYNEHTTEKRDGVPAVMDSSAIKSSIVADLKVGRFESAFSGIARLDILATPTVDAKTLAGMFQERQYRPWATQRRREFEQQVKRAQLLVDRRQESFAAYHLALAYAIAPAQDALRTQDWFVKLTRAVDDAAGPNEKARKWLACWRIYINLVQIDPQDVASKLRLMRVERRIRLMRLYAPEQFRRLQDDDDRDRIAAGESPAPDAKPAATAPAVAATKPATDGWRAEVAGATRTMLDDAAMDAGVNYIRPLTLRYELISALQGIEDLVATPGLEKSFPSIADSAKKKAFATELRAILQPTGRIGFGEVKGRDFTAVINSLLAANAQSLKLPEDVLFHELADAMCDSLEGKATMIWPADVARFTRSAATPVAGLGIRLRVAGDGEVVVASCIDGAPAAMAGIRSGDVIETIDQIRMCGSSGEEAAERMIGKPASSVTLVIRRSADGRRQRLLITRREVDAAASDVTGWRHTDNGAWDYYIDPHERIAYLKLNSLQSKTAGALDAILIELKRDGACGIILDLRDNTGGLLSAAHDVSKRFIRAGIILRTRAERETPEPPQEKYVVESEERQWTEMPLVVLVNAGTCGGAEVIAAAVQDNARGSVVGERTAGRGDVQMLFPLANRTAYLKLTTHALYRRTGKPISAASASPGEWGVEPNVPVILPPDQARAAADARGSLSSGSGAGAAAAAAAADQALIADFQLSMALLVMRLKLVGVFF
jgi:carboxyl-terminal processing protease